MKKWQSPVLSPPFLGRLMMIMLQLWKQLSTTFVEHGNCLVEPASLGSYSANETRDLALNRTVSTCPVLNPFQ